MNKDQFVAIVNRNGSLHEKDLEDIEFNWRAANEAALSVSAAMPGIGFFLLSSDSMLFSLHAVISTNSLTKEV
nr:hypothetical protein [uncultured Halomonas sp.]